MKVPVCVVATAEGRAMAPGSRLIHPGSKILWDLTRDLKDNSLLYPCQGSFQRITAVYVCLFMLNISIVLMAS